MSSIQILMNDYNGACYPGQTIAGKIECNFYEETNLRAVRIKFTGRAETQWKQSETVQDRFCNKRRLRKVRYNAVEPYFEVEYNLVEGGDNFTLSSGRHTYPFSYILPPKLPSSYEGVHGNVRYYIKATVDCSCKFDYEHEIRLNIVSPLDLNYFPELRDPVNTSVDKTMCSCWCNDAGVLTFNISLPATGFVSGQEISIGAHVANMTNVKVEKVKFKIFEETEFIAYHPSTKSIYHRPDSVVARCLVVGIGAHREKSWTSCIKLPPAHMPNLNPCSIINIKHILKAVIAVRWPHTNLEVNVPITIGAIPLSGITAIFPDGPPPKIPFPLSSGPISESLVPNDPGGDTKYQPATAS